MQHAIESSHELVGRGRERATLRDCLTAAVAGVGGLVLIGGVAGIGKTALAEAACREAEAAGAFVLVGRCYDLMETPPYGPWRDLLARAGAARDCGLPPLLDALRHWDERGAMTNQSALFNDVKAFLHALALRGPLVLLLDDLHWADPASVDLLRFVARALPALPVLLIVTYRDDEPTVHPMERIVPLLVREARALRIALQPLPAADVYALVARRYALPAPETAQLVAYVQERAQGNPFFIGELLHSVEAEGALMFDVTAWRLASLEALRLPALLRQVIAARLAQVDAEAQRLLAVAAVIGQETPYALWAAVAAVDEEALLDRITPAVERALLVEAADGTRARFAHALTRAALYEGIQPSRRRRLHREVAERLIADPRADPDAVAHHLRQAGDPRAVAWLARAGARAERAFAPLTAAERYAAALALFDAHGTTDPAARGWLLHGLARARRYVAPLFGIPLLDDALRHAEEADDAALRGATLRLRGLLHCYVGDVARGLPEMAAAVGAIRALTSADRARLVMHLDGTGFGASDGFGTYIGWLGVVGRCAETRALGEPVVAAILAAPDAARDPGDVIADSGLAPAYAALGMPQAARDAWARYRAANTAIGDHPQVHSAWSYEAMFVHLPYEADRLEERRRIATETERARARAHGSILYPPNYMLQSFLFIEGAWDEIDAIHRTVREAGVATQVHLGWAGVLGPLAHARGDYAGAWGIVRATLPDGPTTEPGRHPLLDALPVIRLAAALATEERDLPTARAWLAMHDRWLAWSGAILGAAEGALGWSVYHGAAGDTSAAYEAASRALALAMEPRQPLALLTAHRRVGELKTASGRYAEAAAHLDISLALAVACNAVYARAETLLALADLRCATGTADNLPALLDAVRAVAVPIGAAPLVERAAARAARAMRAGVTPPIYPGGLTAREVDVLRAIAAGKSNKQIADALAISVRTVDRHIANIYLKIDAHNKADATAYALRHGLTQ